MMAEMDSDTRNRIEAAAFRRLVQHLQQRSDVQNVDLMGLSGFCRNCMADWYRDAAAEAGVDIDRDAAREDIYGMPYAAWKERYQQPATEAQRRRMDESVAKNSGRGF